MQKFKNEIIEDKSLLEFGELIKSIIFAVTDVGSIIVVKVAEVVEAVAHAVQTVLVAFIESIEKHIIPAFREVIERITSIVVDIVNTLVDIAATILASISQVVEKYQPEIKQIIATFGELSQDIGRFIQKAYEQVRKIISNLYKKIVEELKAIPVFEELQAQWEDVSIAQIC